MYASSLHCINVCPSCTLMYVFFLMYIPECVLVCMWVHSTCIGEICNALWCEACGLLLRVALFVF